MKTEAGLGNRNALGEVLAARREGDILAYGVATTGVAVFAKAMGKSGAVYATLSPSVTYKQSGSLAPNPRVPRHGV